MEDGDKNRNIANVQIAINLKHFVKKINNIFLYF